VAATGTGGAARSWYSWMGAEVPAQATRVVTTPQAANLRVMERGAN
jgi:hypothetical protein